MEDQIELSWRKASYSGNGGGSCVEVGTGLPSKVAVRDSKDREGPKLIVSGAAWSKFVQRIKLGEFDL
jgi:hypothetical protein